MVSAENGAEIYGSGVGGYGPAVSDCSVGGDYKRERRGGNYYKVFWGTDWASECTVQVGEMGLLIRCRRAC